MLVRAYSGKIGVIFRCLKDQKLIKKANLHGNCNMQKSLLNISAEYHKNRSL